MELELESESSESPRLKKLKNIELQKRLVPKTTAKSAFVNIVDPDRQVEIFGIKSVDPNMFG
jgi:hypothetical protein